MEEAEACQNIADNHETAIWEDGEGTLEEADEERPRPRSPRLRSRSRDNRHDRDDRRKGDDRDDRRKGGAKGKESKGKKGKAVVAYQGKGSSSSSLSWRDQQIVEATRDRVIESVVSDQQEKVFAFAKTLGKCEAVIRTATRVARSCVSAFED